MKQHGVPSLRGVGRWISRAVRLEDRREAMLVVECEELIIGKKGIEKKCEHGGLGLDLGHC